MDAVCALGGGGREDQPAHEVRPDQRELLGDEAADRETKDVEGDDASRRGEVVHQRGVPVVEVPAEVLKQDERHLAPLAGIAVGEVDAARRADQLVREA